MTSANKRNTNTNVNINENDTVNPYNTEATNLGEEVSSENVNSNSNNSNSNNSNNDNRDEIDSALIKMEALQKEYDVTLQQYQEAVNNYVSLLESSSNETKEYTSLKGRAWWGTSALKEGKVESQEECENMCAESSECSGATFNSVSRYCWTRKGNSSLTVGRDDDYALIPKIKSALETMKYLNNKLLALNKQITEQMYYINPSVTSENEANTVKQDQLNTSYEQLLEQNIEVNKQIEDYYSLEQEEENQELYVTQQNSTYKLWLIITGLVLIVTINKLVGSENPTVSGVFWIITLILLVVLSYGLSKPSGFLLWFILIAFIVLMKTNNIPNP